MKVREFSLAKRWKRAARSAVRPVALWTFWAAVLLGVGASTPDAPLTDAPMLTLESDAAGGPAVKFEGIGRLGAPEGKFVDVEIWRGHHGMALVACAVRVDGVLVCWGEPRMPDWGQQDVQLPSGTFTQVALSRTHGCALRADRSVACWGNNAHGQTDPPEGEFTDNTVGDDHDYVGPARQTGWSCALRVDGLPMCWGSFALKLTAEITDLQFVALLGSNCALDPNGQVHCWTTDRSAIRRPEDFRDSYPEGYRGTIALSRAPEQAGASYAQRFAVSAFGRLSCGAMGQGTLECWTRPSGSWAVEYQVIHAPKVEYMQISMGIGGTICGIRTNLSVDCWFRSSYEDYSPDRSPLLNSPTYTPPEGSFVRVSATDYHACGIRFDGGLQCWGFDDAELNQLSGCGNHLEPGCPA